MANNTLIRGAALTGKKFLDVGAAVAKGLQGIKGTEVSNDRVAKNNAVKNRVNSYMGKMKTDMDFTSFSPSETKTMRSFLLSQRTKYTDAAKMAAKYDDTTDPNYMLYVDEMQSVNNSFTNLASQLKSYKKSKLDFAQGMQEGLYSAGNPTFSDNDPIKDASIMYGFYDNDGDGRSEANYDAPFQIQDGGNIAFNIRGREVSYNNAEEPFLKDTKFLNSLTASSEKAYNAGASGNIENPYAEKAYLQSLNDNLQNEDALRSIIFDFDPEAPMGNIGSDLDNGIINLETARKMVLQKLTEARKEAHIAGKKEYDKKQIEQNPVGVGYFENPTIKKAVTLAENRILNPNYIFQDTGVDVLNLERQGPLGDSVKQSYYFKRTGDGKVLISTNKAGVKDGFVPPSDTFDPALDADVKRALKEFGINIVPTF